MKLLSQYEVEQMRQARRYDGQPKSVSGKFGKLSEDKASAGRALVGAMRGRPTAPAPSVNVASKPDDQVIAAHLATIADLRQQIADRDATIAVLRGQVDALQAAYVAIEPAQMPAESPDSPSVATQADAQVEAETPKQRYDRLNKSKRAEAARLRRAKLANQPT